MYTQKGKVWSKALRIYWYVLFCLIFHWGKMDVHVHLSPILDAVTSERHWVVYRDVFGLSPLPSTLFSSANGTLPGHN